MSKYEYARSRQPHLGHALAAPSAFGDDDYSSGSSHKIHYKAGDPSRIFNPDTGKYVLLEGSVGQNVIAKYGWPAPQEGGFALSDYSDQLSNSFNDIYNNLKSTWDSLFVQNTLGSQGPTTNRKSGRVSKESLKSVRTMQPEVDYLADTYADAPRIRPRRGGRGKYRKEQIGGVDEAIDPSRYKGLYEYINRSHYNAVTPYKERSGEGLAVHMAREAPYLDDFVAALEEAAAGRPITRDDFIIAHATYMGDGEIPDGIFTGSFPDPAEGSRGKWIAEYLAQRDLPNYVEK